MKGEYLLDYRGRAVNRLAGTTDLADAEACFQQSLALAREQGAKWYELRTTVSLAKLWHTQGRGDEADRALTNIYNWFTEGFDTPDLQEAKQVIESGQKYKES